MKGAVELLPALLARRATERGGDSPAQLKEACQEFEAIFLGHILKCMRATIPSSTLFGKSTGQRIFEELLDDQVAGEMAHTGSLGLAELLQRDLTSREAAPSPEQPPEPTPSS